MDVAPPDVENREFRWMICDMESVHGVEGSSEPPLRFFEYVKTRVYIRIFAGFTTTGLYPWIFLWLAIYSL